MQSVVFTGRLADDPFISPDGGRASFRLLENRGERPNGEKIVNGVNCVAWGQAFVAKVIAPGLARGCEATVTGRFEDKTYTTQDGVQRTAKSLVVAHLAILDWAEHRAEPERRAA